MSALQPLKSALEGRARRGVSKCAQSNRQAFERKDAQLTAGLCVNVLR